jgi:hypothetical protein
MPTKTRGLISIRGSHAKEMAILFVLSLIAALGGCGSGSTTQFPITATGDWQFSMSEQLNSDPTKPSFTGGLQGGFLVQNGTTIFGQATFTVMTQPPYGSGGTPTPCNSGIAPITGTISGQTVNLTATSVGQQTYTFTGTLSFDGTIISGSYTSTDGAGCGIAATQAWSANLIPPLTSTSVQGLFHSMGGLAGLNEQDFVVTGELFEGTNTGASSAPITGSLNFSSSNYPCVGEATVTGQISGSTVSLQIIGSGNTTVGQMGQPTFGSAAGLQPLTFISSGNGWVLQSLSGVGYAVFAPGCGGGTLQAPADSGSVCLGVTSTSACQLPLSISPGYLSFPAQSVGSSKTTYTVTLTNPSNVNVVDGLSISFANSSGLDNNFSESDNCGLGGASSQGQSFALQPIQFCYISVAYTPKQSCPSGSSSSECLTASLSIVSAPLQTIFNVPVTGAVSGGDAAAQGFEFDEFGGSSQLRLDAPGKVNSQNSENHAEIE